ncbi:transposase [Nitrosomonas oligotropha]|nr:transposase [Nitrosomonas oligotropha]
MSAAGRPRLPIRLMASLLYLKHAFNLSDEELVIRWSENVVWQYFSGQVYYTPKLPCDVTQIGRLAYNSKSETQSIQIECCQQLTSYYAVNTIHHQ